ncbi:hypothetical protein GTO91_17270 [Heliobacterium undosum]|uniref:Uncharacterized protein n=1 Tax=Heliomicrobium undosum TaxID=121734 RepID=A0A845L8V3_9FIRM|nr:hypothetical protein [Heliomicrobium undosum]MZP31445.1 hypothetical protein [Heliomicrobium undosum]
MSLNETKNHDAIGDNICKAVSVVYQTYENLNRFFGELDNVGAKEGFVPLVPRFIRWKSDADPGGWAISSFIKPFQLAKDPILKNGSEMRNGPIYVVEALLSDESKKYVGRKPVPQITLGKFTFDFENRPWTTISVSDHWFFYYPTRMQDKFDIEQSGENWISKPKNEKVTHDYWGLKNVVWKSIDLVPVNSREMIKKSVFDELLSFPEVK